MNVSDTSHSVLLFGNTTPNENECILHLSSITNKIGYNTNTVRGLYPITFYEWS